MLMQCENYHFDILRDFKKYFLSYPQGGILFRGFSVRRSVCL